MTTTDEELIKNMQNEMHVIHQILYRNKSQHGRTKYYKMLLQVRRIEEDLHIDKMITLMRNTGSNISMVTMINATKKLNVNNFKEIINNINSMRLLLNIGCDFLFAILQCSKYLTNEISKTYFMPLCLVSLASCSRLFICSRYFFSKIFNMYIILYSQIVDKDVNSFIKFQKEGSDEKHLIEQEIERIKSNQKIDDIDVKCKNLGLLNSSEVRDKKMANDESYDDENQEEEDLGTSLGIVVTTAAIGSSSSSSSSLKKKVAMNSSNNNNNRNKTAAVLTSAGERITAAMSDNSSSRILACNYSDSEEESDNEEEEDDIQDSPVKLNFYIDKGRNTNNSEDNKEEDDRILPSVPIVVNKNEIQKPKITLKKGKGKNKDDSSIVMQKKDSLSSSSTKLINPKLDITKKGKQKISASSKNTLSLSSSSSSMIGKKNHKSLEKKAAGLNFFDNKKNNNDSNEEEKKKNKKESKATTSIDDIFAGVEKKKQKKRRASNEELDDVFKNTKKLKIKDTGEVVSAETKPKNDIDDIFGSLSSKKKKKKKKNK